MGCLTVFTFLFIRIWILLSAVHGIPRFTRKPPTIQYASSGGTARLVWDYHVDNRIKEFDPYSPEWYLYNTSGVKVPIGADDGFNGWSFLVHGGCPPGLRERVSKEDTATLVISNVTTNDSGVYGCALVFTSWSPIKSEVRLIVTDPPRFISTLNPITVLTEGSNLSIRCSALGNPVPDVTWTRLTRTNNSNIINEGTGKTLLTIINITRQQSGKYKCRAANNPNEDPITMQTEVLVQFFLEPANVSVSEIKATSAVIKWLIPLNDEMIVIDYTIQISTMPPREFITRHTCLGINHLKENTTYIVKVYVRNKVGYRNASVMEFTTKYQETPSSTPKAAKREYTTKYRSSLLFFQDRIFTIFHLSLTCLLLVIIVALVTYFCFIFRRNTLKENQQEVTRFVRPLEVTTTNEDAIVLTTMQQLSSHDMLHGVTSMNYLNEDYEGMPENSETPPEVNNQTRGTNTTDIHLSPTHHEYQELNNDASNSLSRDKEYQSLDKAGRPIDITVPKVALPHGKYELLHFDKLKASEYQKLHLYANIDDKN